MGADIAGGGRDGGPLGPRAARGRRAGAETSGHGSVRPRRLSRMHAASRSRGLAQVAPRSEDSCRPWRRGDAQRAQRILAGPQSARGLQGAVRQASRATLQGSRRRETRRLLVGREPRCRRECRHESARRSVVQASVSGGATVNTRVLNPSWAAPPLRQLTTCIRVHRPAYIRVHRPAYIDAISMPTQCPSRLFRD